MVWAAVGQEHDGGNPARICLAIKKSDALNQPVPQVGLILFPHIVYDSFDRLLVLLIHLD